MKSHILPLAAVFALAAARAGADAPPTGPDFLRDVVPILNAYCAGCHGADEAESNLRLDDYDALLKGGKGGVVLVPGQSELSRLVLVLDGRAQPAMPPEGNEAPTAEEISLLKSWIELGATGPQGRAADPTKLVTPQVKLLAEPRRPINALAVHPTLPLAAAAGYGRVSLVSAENRAATGVLDGLRGNVTDVEFSRDGKLLATAAGEPGLFGEAQLWAPASGSLIKTFTGHRDSLYAVALSPDDKLLATAGYDQQIILWDTASGSQLRALAGHNGAVFDLAFHPSGKILASASADRTVKLWSVDSGARLDTLGQSLKELNTVAFSPDGRLVVAGGVDNRIRVWRVGPGGKEGSNPLLFARFAHEGAILKLVFSADGQTLASAAEDRTVRLWNTRQFTERHLLEEQPDWPAALAFTRDGKHLLVGRLDGSLAFYETASGRLVPPPRPELVEASPRGVQSGGTARVRLAGKNLVDVSGVAFAAVKGRQQQPTARLVQRPAATASEAWIEVGLPADLPRGDYMLTVTTHGGTSNAIPLYVDELPQHAEREPNDLAATVEPIPMPAIVWGAVTSGGDVDHFRFQATAGQTIVGQLDARSLGSTLAGVLTILDPDGRVVDAVHDSNERGDPIVACTAAADGVYTVRVKDLAMSGSPEHTYRLAVGALPLVTGVFPFNVPAGQPAEVELIGFNLPSDARAALAAEQPGELPVPLDRRRYRAAAPLKVRATAETELVESEPNDLPEAATPLAVPGNVHGRLSLTADAPDVDLFRFEARGGQAYVVETEAARRGSPADTKIEILDAAGAPVPRVVLQAVRDSYITFRSIDSNIRDARVKNWEEMELNELMYLEGEVCKIFRMPQGPDSGFLFYGSNNKRRCYFDTSATAHALDEPCYIVEPHPPHAKLIPNGLPIFTIYYANDDDALRRLGSDSRLVFTPPADGAYLVRVTDVRGFGGDRYAYRLSVRPAQPDFQLRLATPNPTVSPGSAVGLSLSVERYDDFDDDITVHFDNLPEGFQIAGPLVVEAGHDTAETVLSAAAGAVAPPPEAWQNVRITARAAIGGRTVEHAAAGRLGAVKLGAAPKVLVRIEPSELTIQPGTTIAASLVVERSGYDGGVPFDVNNLPHGVIVANIGLNGVLIPAGKSRQQIFLEAAAWVGETDRHFFAQTKNFRGDNAGEQASPPVLLRVRQSSTVAQAAESR